VRRSAVAVLLVGCACRRASATDRNPSPATATATPTATATATATATPTPTATPIPSATSPLPPFGPPSPVARYTCAPVLAGGPFRAFIAAADTRVAFIDGDDLLALVNRSPSGALPPTYAPSDLVDLRDGTARSPAECESAHACLRREAAAALHHMLDQMLGAGLRGMVQSAFRGFATQCWVFAGWARRARSGFCEATEQSALPGHSQHQLGTTVDMFTSDWAEQGAKTGQGVFRNGFGCTAGGQWLDENAWRYGFVVPYPIDPDDRKDGSRCLVRGDRTVPVDPKTGYKHEPWHLRFIGVDAAMRYHEAWLASDPGTPREIALEQWLREKRGLVGDAELPVCDGCGCGACATLAGDTDKTPCGDGSLRLEADARVAVPDERPRLVDAHALATQERSTLLVEVTVHAPPHTPTQTPVTTADGPTYGEADTFESLIAYPHAQPHRYASLPGAWRLAIEPVPAGPIRWPWRVSLARPELAATWNRANVVLPAKAGDATVRVRVVVPPATQTLNVALLRDGEEHDVRQVPLP
jgi:D-alanyl-D-alanine carboxypeptidase